MKRILSLFCVLAMVLGMITVPAFATEAETLQDKVDAYTSGVITMTEDVENLKVQTDTYIDLNGYYLTGVTVADGATLYVADSQTKDYTVEDGVYGTVTGITGAVEPMDGYVAICEEDAVSFHCVDLSIKSMSLRPGNAGVYYTSNFAADEMVSDRVESYGVALSVVDVPTAENLDTLCGYSVLTGFGAGEKSGTLLTGIMSQENDAETNAAHAAMDVYGRAYIQTADGYTFGKVAVRNLQQQVEAIDALLENLTETQKTGFLAFYNTYKDAMTDWNIPNLRSQQLGDIVITVPVQTENGVVTETVTVEQDGMSVTVPFGTLVEKAELTLNVTKKAQSDSGIEAAADETLMPFDVHVEGVSTENTVPLTVALGKVMPENLNMGNYSIYHVEKDGTKEMTLVSGEEDFTAHNQYKYTLDGELTLHMATFSEIAALTNDANVWNGGVATAFGGGTGTDADPYLIRNADQLAYLNVLISADNGDYNTASYKLLSDIDFGGAVNVQQNGNIWYPIGYWHQGDGVNAAGEETWYTYGGAFMGTFDGNGHKIANIHQNTWSLNGNYDYGYWDEAMGLFGYVYNGTVKNLTMERFYSEGEFTPTGCVAAYAANSTFENIALVECNPCVYNTGNGGIVGIGGNTGDTDNDKLTFNNITIDNSNKITALWGSWDVACGGLIGMFRGAGQVYMNNCHVAAQIDVYNDVCGNYQYYWYRYSGMLVGTNKNMITVDGKVYPETEKYHAVGCTVHFGDWNNYYYCELVANSLASYTHDHQFSRLTEIESIDEIKKDDAWTRTGNFVLFRDDTRNTETAQCFHIVKAEDGSFVQHNHDDAGEETVNGETVLKEDKQIVYLPFNQLFTGYGWGVNHIPIYNGEECDFKGVTILDREYANSVVKFENLVEADDEYITGMEINVGDLFGSANAEVAIVPKNVQVTVSPVGEGSTVSGTYTANTTEWEKGTLSLSGYGKAKITITDYFFCVPTEVEIYVGIEQADVNALAKTMDFETLADASGTVKATCPVCIAAGDATIKDWKPLPVATSTTSYSDGKHHHFYLDEDLNYTKNASYYILQKTDNTKMCLNLNGQEIVSKKRALIVDRASCVMNVMGEGKVSGGSGSVVMSSNHNYSGLAIDTTGAVNLYGGTYSAKDNFTGDYTNNPIVSARGTSVKCALNIYDDVKIIRDDVDAPGWCVYMADAATVNMYGGEIRGGSAFTHEYYADNVGFAGGNIVVKVRSHGDNDYTAKLIVWGGKLIGEAENLGGNIAVIGNNNRPKSKASITIRDCEVTGGSIRSWVDNTSFSVLETPLVDNWDLSGDHKITVGAIRAGADVKITAPLNTVISDKEFTETAVATYFESTTPGQDVTLINGYLTVTDDVCKHCDTANAEIKWESLTENTIDGLVKKCLDGSNYYLPSGHYRMDGDIGRSKQVFIGNFKSESSYGNLACDVALDLNNYTYYSSSDDSTSKAGGNRVFYVINEGSHLSIMDNSATKGGEIIGNYASSGAAIFAKSGPTVDVYGGTLSWERDAYTTASGVVDTRGGILNVYEGATLNGVNARGAGATVYAAVDSNTNKAAKVNIYGGILNGGSTTTNGGTLAIIGSVLNVYGGRIYEGNAGSHGNTIYVSNSNSVANFMGGRIEGEIYATSAATVKVSGNPVITDMNLLAGEKLNVGELTAGASITVSTASADGVFTGANAEQYKSYFHAFDSETMEITVVDTALAVTEKVIVEEPTEPEPTEPEATKPEATEPTE